MKRVVSAGLGLTLAAAGYLHVRAAGQPAGPAPAPGASARSQTAAADHPATPGLDPAFLQRYCFSCHNQRLKTAGLMLDTLDPANVESAAAIWEKVVLKLRGGMMPPTGRPRPDRQAIERFVSTLETRLDEAAIKQFEPRRVPVHRLNRAEYSNAVRDLLDVSIDAGRLLPADESSYGFDNMAGTLGLSPALLDRYMTAARRISRLAVGDPTIGPGFTSNVYSVPMNTVQDDRMNEDLPFGTRGGLSFEHSFPLDGEYEIKIRLTKSVYEYIVNLDHTHDLNVTLDGHRVSRFSVGGGIPGKPAPITYSGTIMASKTQIEGEDKRGGPFPSQEWDDYYTSADSGLNIRMPVKAGRHRVGVSFIEKTWEAEGVLQPPLREYAATVTETTDLASKPEGPGVANVTIAGPFAATGPGETASRRRIFVCRPARHAQDVACARKILSTLTRRAYRRPVSDQDVQPLMAFYQDAAKTRGFEAGIQAALDRLLLDPEFLFRIEREPAQAARGGVYAVDDVALASRLSFFLWSSIPDDELLDAAARGRLKDPDALERQVRRMLADPRSDALVDNFFAQWLSLRSMKGFQPNPNLFPEFDENLREAFETETNLFLTHQLRQDASVLDLLGADYTFLNERLAQHYGIPNIIGSRFRKVTLTDGHRGGLLGQGTILAAATSYGDRTSPVRRAKWVLENVLGAPPPPPPGDVPAFPEERGANGEPRSVRERLEQHRKNPVCANCHAPMDPLGFALENFDAVGKWRTIDAKAPVDAKGVLVDGTTFEGPAELRRILLDRRDEFARTVAEKLLTYALGRGLDYRDAAVLRQVARGAAAHDYRWSAMILEIVKSGPFRMAKGETKTQ
jgi:Protein of unknown function (DUF1592)/Protein of unknown function (DUF1588)/Protein of unknown function (DUF1585)/Protein of unknown function (DUF1587)/Protein of unknown function (DUF1595)/Planctomycete cytochrome C